MTSLLLGTKKNHKKRHKNLIKPEFYLDYEAQFFLEEYFCGSDFIFFYCFANKLFEITN